MKRFIVSALVLVMTVILVLSVIAEANTDDVTAVCYNGRFTGTYEEETGVLSFKGIPYAKSPVGGLRWKAPEAVEASDETFSAAEFGKSSIQYYWFSEDITTEVSEDCLTLNVWTADLSGFGKPVMVFFHGGSYAWGGTSEPLYNGQYIVNEHRDVVVVTCNYRVGFMGFIDLSSVPGGEEYTDSVELGLLDSLESLRWIKQNISAFGGDPENITIFGESAGGSIVSCLLATDYAGELFNRAIVESGALNQTNNAEEAADSYQTEILMALSGAETMEDLLALTEEDLILINETPIDEEGNCLNDCYRLPFRGGAVPEDPYAAIANAKAKGVDLLIGTNADEANYWIAEFAEDEIQNLESEEISQGIAVFYEYFVEPSFDAVMSKISETDRENVNRYMELRPELSEAERKTMIMTEYMFRAASVRMAECYSEAAGEGRTYMYLFDKNHSDFDFMGACHASELAYVFHNLEYNGFCGVVDEALADDICAAWVSFAKAGDPSTDEIKWTQYDITDRNTMVIGNDCSMQMVSDPMGGERELTKGFGYYYTASIGI